MRIGVSRRRAIEQQGDLSHACFLVPAAGSIGQKRSRRLRRSRGRESYGLMRRHSRVLVFTPMALSHSSGVTCFTVWPNDQMCPSGSMAR